MAAGKYAGLYFDFPFRIGLQEFVCHLDKKIPRPEARNLHLGESCRFTGRTNLLRNRLVIFRFSYSKSIRFVTDQSNGI